MTADLFPAVPEVDSEFTLSDVAMDALAEFLLNHGHLADADAPDADQQEGRQRSIEAAERELDQAGL